MRRVIGSAVLLSGVNLSSVYSKVDSVNPTITHADLYSELDSELDAEKDADSDCETDVEADADDDCETDVDADCEADVDADCEFDCGLYSWLGLAEVNLFMVEINLKSGPKKVAP